MDGVISLPKGQMTIDEAISSLQDLIKRNMPKEKGKWSGGSNQAKTKWKRKGHNQAISKTEENFKRVGLL